MGLHSDKGDSRDLAIYRLETAYADLKSAKVLFRENDCRGANNRAYYSIYHAISAVHALDGNAYKRHKDAISNFNKNYVKTEIIPKSFGRKIAEAEEIRHASDYDDFYLASKEEAEELIETAEKLIECIEEYCERRTKKTPLL